MPKQVQISPEVHAVLARCTVRDNTTVVLPDGQLERPLYAAVDKVLKALGGRWNRSAGGHVFAQGISDQLAAALQAGVAVDEKRTAEQFFTPPAIARRMFALAQLRPEDHVLEPSAGRGALLVDPITLGCAITAVEQDAGLAERLARYLFDEHDGQGYRVWAGDFLKWKQDFAKPIDVVLMNPPFSRNQDIAHVMQAFNHLRAGGRMVAIMSPHFTYANDRPSKAFRQLIGYPGQHEAHAPKGSEEVAEATVALLPAGTFKAEGTNVASVLVHIIKAG